MKELVAASNTAWKTITTPARCRYGTNPGRFSIAVVIVSAPK